LRRRGHNLLPTSDKQQRQRILTLSLEFSLLNLTLP
jgi:hypothetical protein